LVYTTLGAPPLNLQLDAQIKHGPLLFTSTGPALGLVYAQLHPAFDSTEIRQALAELPFSLPPAQLTLRVGFLGKIQVNLDVDPVTFADGTSELEFAGLQARFLAYADQSAEFRFTLGALAARESGTSFEFSLEGLEFSSFTEQISDLLAPSSAHFVMTQFKSEAPYPVTISDLALDSRLQPSSAGADRSDLFQRIHIAQIDSDLPLGALTWTMEFNEIRNDLFRRYYMLLAEMQSEMNDSSGTVTTQLSESLQEMSLLLLQNRLVLNNSIAADIYDGEHNLDLRLLWRGLPDLTEIARLDTNAALAAMELTLDVSLDLEAFLRGPLAGLVDSYVREGYWRLENGRILTQASLIDGKLVLNGASRSLDELF